jgi:hypothetical protein
LDTIRRVKVSKRVSWCTLSAKIIAWAASWKAQPGQEEGGVVESIEFVCFSTHPWRTQDDKWSVQNHHSLLVVGFTCHLDDDMASWGGKHGVGIFLNDDVASRHTRKNWCQQKCVSRRCRQWRNDDGFIMDIDEHTCLTCCPGGLPPDMMCRGCQTAHGKAINISDRGGKGRMKRTRCEQHFHSKYKNHYHKKKRIMFERVQAYILQHSAVSASDPLSPSEVETLVGNDTTMSRTPLAPIDANANGGRVLHRNLRTIEVSSMSRSHAELIMESLLAYVLDRENCFLGAIISWSVRGTFLLVYSTSLSGSFLRAVSNGEALSNVSWSVVPRMFQVTSAIHWQSRLSLQASWVGSDDKKEKRSMLMNFYPNLNCNQCQANC